ncbi:VCBS domain-containing protein, partial [Vibrio sp. 10N.261.51.F12]
DGSWDYDIPNAAVEYLPAGVTATETFTVLSKDGTPFEVVITITGTDDAPVIGGNSEGTITEDYAPDIV